MNAGFALMTDFYEFTMAAGYFENRFNPKATFELYCHTLPHQRSYLLVCGLRDIIQYITRLKFSTAEVKYLKSLPVFQNVSKGFFEYLRAFKFSGDVWAMPEGEVCFANEPILQIEAPIIEAQILETYLLSMINIQTLVASKAARIVRAAQYDGTARPVIDFGSRRAHGPEAGVLAARGAYVGGCLGTSNVLAGHRYNIPVLGTMAHSWVQAFDNEETAFRNYQNIFPRHTVLLVDTYNTLQAVRRAAAFKKAFSGVRLDSGDLLALSVRVRRILDRAGRSDVKIIASGNLDEYKIQTLVKNKAPIDIFGVGTEMVVSGDAPSLDLTYKLVQLETKQGTVSYTAKLSCGKHTIPGRKQVYRMFDAKQQLKKDMITLAGESAPVHARPLLAPVIRRGRPLKALPSLADARTRAEDSLRPIPSCFLRLERPSVYPVEYSPEIMAVSRAVQQRGRRRAGR
ncbi:MAG TPA: nicotinate phosphoribosyltransferase [Candidatus Omnitrophota bacterium]|nr:nicotinate phosphoribosyltransferase [Candidatus Omnitrophota bacterium]